MGKRITVAVDGTAGSGKTATFSKVAKKVGYEFIDTGLMYRAFTLLCINNCVDFNNKTEIIKQLDNFYFEVKDGLPYLNGLQVEKRVQESDIVSFINFVTPIKEIRSYMVEKQRDMVKGGGFIELGRDITSVVLPNAELKIYLDSSVESRALRRFKQNQENGILNNDLSEISESIKKRDEQDKINVLRVVEDAWYIDNSDLTIDEVVDMVVKRIKELECD